MNVYLLDAQNVLFLQVFAGILQIPAMLAITCQPQLPILVHHVLILDAMSVSIQQVFALILYHQLHAQVASTSQPQLALSVLHVL